MTNIEVRVAEALEDIRNEMCKDKEINWEQRRYEIATAVLPKVIERFPYKSYDTMATKAIYYADALINELKK